MELKNVISFPALKASIAAEIIEDLLGGKPLYRWVENLMEDSLIIGNYGGIFVYVGDETGHAYLIYNPDGSGLWFCGRTKEGIRYFFDGASLQILKVSKRHRLDEFQSEVVVAMVEWAKCNGAKLNDKSAKVVTEAVRNLSVPVASKQRSKFMEGFIWGAIIGMPLAMTLIVLALKAGIL